MNPIEATDLQLKTGSNLFTVSTDGEDEDCSCADSEFGYTVYGYCLVLAPLPLFFVNYFKKLCYSVSSVFRIHFVFKFYCNVFFFFVVVQFEWTC